ncbi:MAG: hypothetical protein GYB67_19330 [Chloroflexi bacterium]|nr:hypothetical protein [Chloroflexota bacterium]
MATAEQRDRLRADLDASSSAISDTDADDLFARAEARYPRNSAASEAYTRLLALRQLLAAAAKRSDYAQNESRESLGQIFDHLQRLRATYADDLQAALADTEIVTRFGGLRRKPTRIEELPDA